jgi:hypothetical protein
MTLVKFREALVEHIPYATTVKGRTGLQCLTCLDGKGAGEFADAYEWADHVFGTWLALGYAVRRVREGESVAAADALSEEELSL